MIGIVFLLDFMKITKELLETINAIKILFSGSVQNPPQTSQLRFIFLSLLLFSMIYSDDLYSTLISIVTVQGEVAFDTFKEIDESHLQTYVHT